MAGYKFVAAADPVNDDEFVTKGFADLNFYANTTRLNQIVQPNADVDIAGFKITNAADPVNATDLVTKQFLDAEIGAIQ